MYRRYKNFQLCPFYPPLCFWISVSCKYLHAYIPVFKAMKNLTHFPFLFCTPWQGETSRKMGQHHPRFFPWQLLDGSFRSLAILGYSLKHLHLITKLVFCSLELNQFRFFPSTCFSLDRKTLPRRQSKYIQKDMQRSISHVVVAQKPTASKNFVQSLTERGWGRWIPSWSSAVTRKSPWSPLLSKEQSVKCQPIFFLPHVKGRLSSALSIAAKKGHMEINFLIKAR